MDKFDRIQQLHRIFNNRKTPISKAELAEQLECSEKTITRSIDNLRDYLQAPLAFCPQRKGWYYDSKQNQRFELPGMWLTENEILSLSTMMTIVRSMDEGFLKDDSQPLINTLNKLLQSRGISPESFDQTLKFVPRGKRPLASQCVPSLLDALLNTQQVELNYLDFNQSKTKRTVSPIRLIYYQDNWYLDAYCHLRNQLRSFMVARIQSAKSTKRQATTISAEQVAAHYQQSYGIFAGEARAIAALRFTGNAANDAAGKHWHTKQKGHWQGSDFLLQLPFNDDRELIRDILAYGEQVEVLAPSALRQKVQKTISRMHQKYQLDTANET